MKVAIIIELISEGYCDNPQSLKTKNLANPSKAAASRYHGSFLEFFFSSRECKKNNFQPFSRE